MQNSQRSPPAAGAEPGKLAHELGVSFSINRWENGKTVPFKLAKGSSKRFVSDERTETDLMNLYELKGFSTTRQCFSLLGNTALTKGTE